MAGEGERSDAAVEALDALLGLLEHENTGFGATLIQVAHGPYYGGLRIHEIVAQTRTDPAPRRGAGRDPANPLVLSSVKDVAEWLRKNFAWEAGLA